MPALHHVSLFSGVGGFELAMAEARIPTIAACEIDKKARGVLHKHPNAPDQANPHITTRRAAVAACLPAGSPWRAVAAANGGRA